MSPEIIGLIGVAILVVLLFLRVWIGIAMGVVGFLGFAYVTNFKYACMIIGSVPYTSIANETVAAVPLFILMGAVVSNTGVGGDLYQTAYKWFGQLRGGVAMATVVACGGFAAISGSSSAAAATMGKLALPEMKKYHYDNKLATGCVAAGGTIGILIPPSMGFILYGILTEISIGKLFMAGIIPGILEVVFYIGAIFVMCRFNPTLGPAGPKTVLKEKLLIMLAHEEGHLEHLLFGRSIDRRDLRRVVHADRGRSGRRLRSNGDQRHFREDHEKKFFCLHPGGVSNHRHDRPAHCQRLCLYEVHGRQPTSRFSCQLYRRAPFFTIPHSDVDYISIHHPRNVPGYLRCDTSDPPDPLPRDPLPWL